MNNNSIPYEDSKTYTAKTIRSYNDIKNLSNISEKTKSFLTSIFNELDLTDAKGNNYRDKILQEKEGSIYLFDDGSISITKDGKFYAGISASEAQIRTNGDYLNIKFSDGSESVMKDNKLVSGKTDQGKTFTVKDGVVTFDETKAIKSRKQVEKQKINNAASAVTETEKTNKQNAKINGISMEVLNDIAEKYLELVKSDYEQNDKINFYFKHLKTFSKAIGEKPRALTPKEFEEKRYEYKKLETDKYNMYFSSNWSFERNRYYWELHQVDNKK